MPLLTSTTTTMLNYGLNTRPFQHPARPVALRADRIAAAQTRLHLVPECNPRSESDYTIIDDADESDVFTVTGKKFGDRPGREFRDASGLPLYELHQRAVPLKQPWSVRLPGGDSDSLVSTQLWPSLRGYRTVSCEFKFQNAAAIDNKHPHEKSVKLHTQRRPSRLYAFDVLDGDRKIIEVQESISKNEKLALMSESRRGYHPILDIRVAPGVDLVLAALIAVILSDWMYGP